MPQNSLDFLLILWRSILLDIFCHFFHAFFVGGLEALGHEVLWYKFSHSDSIRIDFLSQTIDLLDQHFFFFKVFSKICFEIGGSEHFLFEVQLLEKIDFMVSKDHPEIIDSIPESIELFSGDWELFFLDCGKLFLFEFHERLESVNFVFFVFDESHDERLGVKKINHVIEVPFKMFEIDGDDGGHVVKLKGFFLVGFEAAFLEDVGVDIVDDFGSREENVDVSFHPKSEGVEFKIDGVFMVVKADIADVGSFEEHVVTINFSEIFAKNQDFGIDKAELEGNVQTDGHEHFLSHFVKMRYQFIRFLSCYLCLWDFWRFIVDFDGFLHVLFLESHKLLTFFNTAHFIHNHLTEGACQLLKGGSVSKAEQYICFGDDYLGYFVLVSLFNAVKLGRVADQDGLC